MLYFLNFPHTKYVNHTVVAFDVSKYVVNISGMEEIDQTQRSAAPSLFPNGHDKYVLSLQIGNAYLNSDIGAF